MVIDVDFNHFYVGHSFLKEFQSMEYKDYVGKIFKCDGCYYRCIEYLEYGDFVMEHLEGVGILFPSRKPGDRNTISNRAINRTYHQVRRPHEIQRFEKTNPGS